MSATLWSGATAAEPRTGTASVGAYEVLALLRAGDAGPLYRVRDAALGRELMLEEFLPPALATRDAAGQLQPALPAAAPLLERARRRFVDEARVLANHEHPRLARVLHLIEAGGLLCRVMPGYAGRPLSDLLAEGSAPRDEAALRTLLADLLGALQAWHAMAGPHGAVQAARVLWSADGHALLLGSDAAGHTTLSHDEGAALPRANVHAIAADVQAAVALVRACMRGGPPGGARYGSAWQETLDAVLTPGPQAPPATPAVVLERLARGAGSIPRAPAAASVPAPTAASAEQVDPATAALIRSIVDAIPEREPRPPAAAAPPITTVPPEPPRKPGRGEVRFVELDLAADGAPSRPQPFVPPPAPPKPRTLRHALMGVAALLLLALLGYGALQVLRDTSPGAPRAPVAARPGAARLAPPPAAVPASVPAAASLTAPAPATAASAPAASPAPAAAAASVLSFGGTPAPANAASGAGAGPDTPPARRARPPAATTAAVSTPRQQCGARTGFSLYRCMQQQCALARWRPHAQCVQLRQTDTVPD